MDSIIDIFSQPWDDETDEEDAASADAVSGGHKVSTGRSRGAVSLNSTQPELSRNEKKIYVTSRRSTAAA